MRDCIDEIRYVNNPYLKKPSTISIDNIHQLNEYKYLESNGVNKKKIKCRICQPKIAFNKRELTTS